MAKEKPEESTGNATVDAAAVAAAHTGTRPNPREEQPQGVGHDGPVHEKPAMDAGAALAELRRQHGGQLPKPHRPGDKVFAVQSLGNDPKFVFAPNQNDAWAAYCDSVKDWPSPKLPRVLVEVTPKKAG